MTGALYAQIYDTLRERIVEGEWEVGDRLPSQEELTGEFSVSAITVKRALDMLRDEGFVTRRPRIGTVVVSRAPKWEGPAGKLPLIGYVVPGFNDAFGTRILGGLLDASATQAHVVVAASHGDSGQEEQLIEEQVSRGIDGLVLQPSSSQYIPPAVASLIGERFPLVILDRTLDGTPVSTVTSDNVEGGRLAAEHLFERGHADLAFVMPSNPVSTLDQRLRGIVDAHAAHRVRLDPEHVFAELGSSVPGSGVTAEADVERLAAFLAEHPEVTGCVAAEYGLARLVFDAGRRLGRSVPEDLSVVSFDAPANFSDATVPLTHVDQDQWAIGEHVFALLQQQLREPGTIAQDTVPVRMVDGESTAPAPRAAH